MQLMTDELETALARFPIGSQEGRMDGALVIVKYFDPCGRWTLYVTEGDKQPDGDWFFFGYALSPLGEDCDEWGYTALSEFQAIRSGPFQLPMERDLYFPISERTVGEALDRRPAEGSQQRKEAGNEANHP